MACEAASRVSSFIAPHDACDVREEVREMTIVLTVLAILAAVYIYAAVAYYYGFKNWYPVCGCSGAECRTL